jgi:Immunity protein 74
MFASINQFFRKFRTAKTTDGTASIIRLGRDEYKYVEGDHTLTLQVEMLSGTPRRVIYSRTIKNWLPPYENERISEQKRKEILERVCKYFDANGISYAVE